jgi:hypothetical protein
MNGNEAQDRAVARFLDGEITAEQLITQLGELDLASRERSVPPPATVPASVIRAQAAIRRINRGR